MEEDRPMKNNPVPPGKPYVYAFSSGRLVLLICMVLLLICFSFMLGIRLQRYQDESAKPPIRESAHKRPSPPAPAPVQPAPKTAPEPVEVAAATPVPEEKTEVKKEPETAPKPKTAVTEVTPDVKPLEPVEKPAEKKPVTPAPKPVAEKKIAAAPPKPVEKKITTPAPEKPAPAPEKPAPAPKKVEATRLHYAVQVAASQDRTQAEHQKELLNKKGFTSYIEVIDLPQKGRFHRVMVGPFKTNTEANAARSQLVKDPTFADCYVRYLP